jgi:hypothetical protein
VKYNTASGDRIIMNFELERMQKKATEAFFSNNIPAFAWQP